MGLSGKGEGASRVIRCAVSASPWPLQAALTNGLLQRRAVLLEEVQPCVSSYHSGKCAARWCCSGGVRRGWGAGGQLAGTSKIICLCNYKHYAFFFSIIKIPASYLCTQPLMPFVRCSEKQLFWNSRKLRPAVLFCRRGKSVFVVSDSFSRRPVLFECCRNLCASFLCSQNLSS